MGKVYTTFKGYIYGGKTPKEFKKNTSKRANITGNRYGKLVTVEKLGVTTMGYILWGCVCDCGTKKAVRARELIEGKTISCGCMQKEHLNYAGKNKKGVGESAFNQLFYNYRRSALLRNHEFNLDVDYFRKLTTQPCYYCGTTEKIKAAKAKDAYGDYYFNGIDRVDNKLGYILGNVVTCCKQCNKAKGVLTECEFMAWVEKIYNHTEISKRLQK